jgi:predicted signal transduction protein with EAL and GGDEF domain
MAVGFGTRRELMAALTGALAPGSGEGLLAVVRLHGLGAWGERAGAVSAGRLLDELYLTVTREVGFSGRFYLPRRDELCVLFDCPLDEAIGLLDGLTAVLNELAAAVEVTAEAGVALLPDEASDPISALERADRRIFPAHYTGGREQALSARRGRRGENEAENSSEDPVVHLAG